MRGDIRGAAVPGSSPGSPHVLDRGDIAIGGGGPRGGGTRSPSPVSHAPTILLPVDPTRAFDKGYLYTSAGIPHPARAFAGGYLCNSLAPLLRRLFRGSTHTLLPAAPAPPAPSALLPRPLPGAGSVRGDIRGAAVPGFSPGSPRALDRGDIATGGGADGEGELVPPPLSLTLQPPYFSSIPAPPAFLRGYPYIFPIPPPRDAGTTWR